MNHCSPAAHHVAIYAIVTIMMAGFLGAVIYDVCKLF